LLGDRFKNDEIALRKRPTHRAIREHKDTQILSSIPERRRHYGPAAKCAAAQFRQLGSIGEFVQVNSLPCLPDAPNQTFTRADCVQSQKFFQSDGRGGRLLQNIRRNID
jgi:hypothetical protein